MFTRVSSNTSYLISVIEVVCGVYPHLWPAENGRKANGSFCAKFSGKNRSGSNF